jgi:hypothetical protein
VVIEVKSIYWFTETANKSMHLQKHYLNTNKTNISTIIIQRQSEASKIDVQALIMVEQYCKFIKSINIANQLYVLYMIQFLKLHFDVE